jgi:hypothetical protein
VPRCDWMAPAMDCNCGSVGVEQEELRRFSTEEVAMHRDEHDAWIVVDGEVYDITEFLQSHPGGAEVSKKPCRSVFLQ